MSKVMIFVKNKVNSPASYYRILQYLDSSNNVKIASYIPDKLVKFYSRVPQKKGLLRTSIQSMFYIIGIIRITYFIIYDMFFFNSDTVIVIRRFFPRRMPLWGSALIKSYLKKRSLFWDFDDNIIYDREIVPKEVSILEEKSTGITVTSEFLRDTIRTNYQSKVKLLPTSDTTFMNIEVKELINKKEKDFDKEFRLAWVGTKVNLQYISMIISDLDKAAELCEKNLNKKLVLYVVSNEDFVEKTKHIIIKNIKWSREKGKEIIAESHAGIMPLEDTKYTRGKGAFKAVQYISAGVPAIVSDVGFNSKAVEHRYNGFLIKNDEKWQSYIYSLAKDKSLWIEMSINARYKWERDFSAKAVQSYWRKIIEK